LTAIDYGSWLWWAMLVMAIMGGALSMAAGVFDRRKTVWPSPQQRFVLHLISYGFMTLSILAFVLRGLAGPA
jgi:hypothetical protein